MAPQAENISPHPDFISPLANFDHPHSAITPAQADFMERTLIHGFSQSARITAQIDFPTCADEIIVSDGKHDAKISLRRDKIRLRRRKNRVR